MSTFKKKVLMPKQIDHWLYRLTGKSDETIYECPIGTNVKRRVKDCMRNVIRFKYETMLFVIREGNSATLDGMKHRSIWILAKDRSSTPPVNKVTNLFKDDFPKTYTEFKKAIDSVLDEFYLKSM